ncbi:MAG: hypothetical protein U0835_27585 [Isosphaeraceae bacterium]
MWPGTNWVSRDKSLVTRHFLQGTPERPVRTLDCGCGNAYFSYEAVPRASTLGITIHDWERQNCEEMRDYLEVPEERMKFLVARLDELADDLSQQRDFDQVPPLRRDRAHPRRPRHHPADPRAARRGRLSFTCRLPTATGAATPEQDLRVSRYEDGWHVRNGYTFEQLEALLEANGFEPIDRLRFGTLGSTVVTWIQHTFFGSKVDQLTIALFPILKLIAWALAPFRDTHTIFVLARKRRDA